MNREQYHYAVQNHDRLQLEKYIATIPLNVNRAGKHFKKLIKQYHEQPQKRRTKTNETMA